MILTVARKDFTGMRRDSRFRISAAIVLMLLAAALVAGYASLRNYAQRRARAGEMDRRAWVN